MYILYSEITNEINSVSSSKAVNTVWTSYTKKDLDGIISLVIIFFLFWGKSVLESVQAIIMCRQISK